MRLAKLVMLVVSCLLAGAMTGQEVMDSDPAQYADVALHIVRSGDWLRLRDMNGPFINKPPLMMQAQAVGLLALGERSSAAIRLPALLFFLLTVAGTWWLGKLLRGGEHGLDAAVLVAGSVALHHMVADPKVDLALTAMVTWSVACFVAGLRRARAYTVAGWGFAALAVLAKGPVGLFLVAGAVGVAVVRERSSASWWAHGLGLLLALGLVSPFYLAMAGAGGAQTLRYLLWAQGPGRLSFGGGEFQDSTTPLYVLHTAAWALLPMSPLVGWALLRRVRAGRRGAGPGRSALDLVPMWWLLTGLLAVALAAFKLPQYVYWSAPAAALVAARALEGFPRWVPVALSVIGAGLGALVLGLMFTPGPGISAALLALLVGAVIVSGAARSGAVAVAASSLGFIGLFDLWIHPALLDYQPSRELREAVAKTGAQRVQLVEVPRTFSLDFYLQRELIEVSAEELRPGLAVVSEEVAQRLGSRATVLGRWPSYRVSVPRWAFLRASSRAQAVSTVTLLNIAE